MLKTNQSTKLIFIHFNYFFHCLPLTLRESGCHKMNAADLVQSSFSRNLSLFQHVSVHLSQDEYSRLHAVQSQKQVVMTKRKKVWKYRRFVTLEEKQEEGNETRESPRNMWRVAKYVPNPHETQQVLSAASCFHTEEIFMFESLMDNIIGRKIRSCSQL